MLQKAVYTERNFHCKGCENSCLVIDYKFGNGKHYYSGNKCERIVSSGLDKEYKRDNAVNIKYSALFERNINVSEPKLRLGIPRCLSMYESYPFWHALFSHCNIEVCLSDESTFKGYEQHV